MLPATWRTCMECTVHATTGAPRTHLPCHQVHHLCIIQVPAKGASSPTVVPHQQLLQLAQGPPGEGALSNLPRLQGGCGNAWPDSARPA